MACGACQKAARAAEFRPSVRSVTGNDGRPRPLNGSLVRPPFSPKGGWKVMLWVGGMQVAVNGESPRAVFREAARLLRLNNVEVNAPELWLNFNIQWAERVMPSRMEVSLETLLAACDGQTVERAPTAARPPVGVSVWLPEAWGLLRSYLAGDAYDREAFLALAEQVRVMADPVRNPTIGDPACYRLLTLSVNDLRLRPRREQAGAREWLVAAMNAVNPSAGLPATTMAAEAARSNWS